MSLSKFRYFWRKSKGNPQITKRKGKESNDRIDERMSYITNT
jgi:hypothetical protein